MVSASDMCSVSSLVRAQLSMVSDVFLFYKTMICMRVHGFLFQFELWRLFLIHEKLYDGVFSPILNLFQNRI